MKQTQFSNKNFIKSFQYYSFPLGVLASNEELYNNWLLGRFTNIFCAKTLQYDEESYEEWDIIESKIYKDLYLYKDEEFELFLKEAVLSDYVVHLWGVNEKYIPSSAYYNKTDYIHDILIIGYDSLSKFARIINTDKSRNLFQSDISLDTLNKTITNNTGGRIFKIKNVDAINYNTTNILNAIKEYISPKDKDKLKYYNDTLNRESDIIVGIYSLNKFLGILEKNIYCKNYLNSIVLIEEHKKVLFSNLNYLYNEKIIDKQLVDYYKKVLNLSNLLKYQYLKFNLKPSDYLLTSLLRNLEEIINIESKILII